jgi:hypothetical protein
MKFYISSISKVYDLKPKFIWPLIICRFENGKDFLPICFGSRSLRKFI